MPPVSAPAGDILRSQRLRRGVSLRALARAMEISAPYLVDLELGRRAMNPTLRGRYRVALATFK
jgi:transcriptional regulator with XRE-family HTH domain